MVLLMKSLELEYFWKMRTYAKTNGGKLISDQFLGKNHPYEWRCSDKHIFFAVFWELKEQNYFCEKCKK
jgi:hypothetical protein